MAERVPQGDGTEKWHGTPGGYCNHRCGCSRCREAWASDHYDYMHRRHPEQLPKHNTRERERRREIRKGTEDDG